MLTVMDEFRAPSRPVRVGGTPYDVSVRSGVTQTPNQTNPPASTGNMDAPSNAVPSVNPSLVNPSLLGGVTPFQPVQSAQPIVAQPTPVISASVVSAPSTPTPTPFVPQSPAPAVDGFVRNFTVPQPQSITPEPATVAAPAVATDPIAVNPAPSVETPPLAEGVGAEPVEPIAPVAPTSPFDIATIQEADKPKNRLRAGRHWRKWAMSAAVIGLSLMIGTGGLLFAQGYSNAHKVFRGTGDTAALAAGAHTTLKGEDKGRVNVLLLGNGGIGHEAPDLTDTMIVASIDTVHKTAVMLSVPRDLWVQVNGSATKINAAYEIGKYNAAGKIDNTNNNTQAVMAGFSTADQAVESVLGIDINYNVLVNFTSFKQAVDAVGGVSVNVPEILYDPTMAWENGNNPVLAQAGVQQMNGTKALMYVRSRETSSDFARSQRQRSVILALKSKVLTAGTLSNPLKLSGLINAFGDNLVTDMTLSEGMRAYDLGKGVDNSKIQTVDLVTPPNNLVTTSSINNASIDVPRAGMFTYTDIQKYVQQLFNPPQAATSTATKTAGTTTSTAPETATISVLNGTTRAGLAGTQATTIKGAGYNVVQTANAPTQAYAKTVVVDLSKGANPKTKQYLQSLYGVTAVTQLPDAAIQPGTASFVVILGSDQVH